MKVKTRVKCPARILRSSLPKTEIEYAAMDTMLEGLELFYRRSQRCVACIHLASKARLTVGTGYFKLDDFIIGPQFSKRDSLGHLQLQN